ncbi:hypothetical protein [Brenneria corticis]|uniref:Uncharacterized protein n=1 Tax=Brenneria corticis TaxID=2173106 RepID=A0A2U1TL44_9GAMM|nr:hypothetical protein [Brenneria sp. CFCC 11842]PWC10123.1 hypothetical protein DDT56_22525 [Brenneria sp. CFCC 11842]
MRILISTFFMLTSTSIFASTSLQSINATIFEKPLYQKALKYSINGGSPVDEQNFKININNQEAGYFISGKGFNQNDDNVCFVGWSVNKPEIIKLIPTIGFSNWEAEVCNKTKSVGIISAKDSAVVKLAVVYEAASPNAIANESVVFTIDKNNNLEIDATLTDKIGSLGATNIAELRKLYNKNN